MVSVVVPVYDVEAYLPRCIDSIIAQTYSNIEIILVNDGSPDNCGQICDEYATKDHRIKVIHKENGGLSDARNAGIRIAKGDFISFIDSDDFVAPNFIEFLMRKIEHHNADIAQCDFFQFFDDSEIREQNPDDVNEYVLTGLEAMESLFLCSGKVNVTSCMKISRIHLFMQEENFFPVGRLHEDNFTTYKLFYRSKTVFTSSIKLYYYQRHACSITGKPFHLKRLDDVAAVTAAVDFVKARNIPLLAQAYYYYVAINFGLMRIIFDERTHTRWMVILKQLRENILTIPHDYMVYCTKHFRLQLFALRVGMKFYIITRPLILLMGRLWGRTRLMFIR